MDGRADLDPEVAAALAEAPTAAVDFGAFDLAGVPALREAMASMPVIPLPPTTTVSEIRTVAGRDGDPDLSVRVYQPADAPRPAPAGSGSTVAG